MLLEFEIKKFLCPWFETKLKCIHPPYAGVISFLVKKVGVNGFNYILYTFSFTMAIFQNFCQKKISAFFGSRGSNLTLKKQFTLQNCKNLLSFLVEKL